MIIAENQSNMTDISSDSANSVNITRGNATSEQSASTIPSFAENQNQQFQRSEPVDIQNVSALPTSKSNSDLATRAFSLPSEYDYTSLNPRVTVRRALSSIYSRWVKILTEEDPRFGSCNEFTIGMSRSPRHSRDTLSSHATNFEQNQEEAQSQQCNQRCTNHERKSSCH